jgi:putative ABC transport system permease protein
MMANLAAANHLAIRYLRQHWRQSLLLAGVLGLVLALPLTLRVLLQGMEQQLLQRANATPLLLGQRGSALDLVLSALHFRLPPPAPMPYAAIDEARARLGPGGQVIPLHLGFHTQKTPIVGTEMPYFSERHLGLQAGTLFKRLGDCVLGAAVAKKRGLAVGDSVISSPNQGLNLAGAYPVRMRITGILTSNSSRDDEVIFVDLKTAWLLEGLAHGHDDVGSLKEEQTLERSAGHTVANAAVPLYREVTDANLREFHFHGSQQDFPLHAALIFPASGLANAVFSGHYQDPNQARQVVVPGDSIRALLASLIKVEHWLRAMLLLTGSGAVAVVALVFALSFRLRQKEFQTLAEMGVQRGQLALVRLLEVVMVLLASGVLLGLWQLCIRLWKEPLLRSLMQLSLPEV